MEKPFDYHPNFKRFILDTKPDSYGMIKTLGLFSFGYYLAHSKMFSKFGTPINTRLAYTGLIFLSAIGWNLALQDPLQAAMKRNNSIERTHQRVFDR